MALGGGVFTSQNKILPGSYINFISMAQATATLSDRGIAAMGFVLDWGLDNDVFMVTAADFQRNSKKLFGYDYAHIRLRPLREIFQYAHTVYCYKLNSANTGIAANEFATAKHSGTRGNSLKIVVSKNVEDANKFDVRTLFDNVVVDEQTVATAADLLPNDYVTFKSAATLTENTGLALTGGANATVTAGSHQNFLDKLEKYAFNALGVETNESTITALYTAFTKRMREEMGIKFQTVLYNTAADHEGIVNVKNTVLDLDVSAAALVPWVTGLIAGTGINQSAMNTVYNGEYRVNVDFTQTQLEAAILAGEFTLHQVGNDVRVLRDINSLVTTTADKGNVFKNNQTIRVIDAIANDIAVLFNTKYLGQIPNDAAGRVSLWADIVQHHYQLQDLRAIEGFMDEHVVVEEGDSKIAVKVTDTITVVNAMEQLYMTCIVA